MNVKIKHKHFASNSAGVYFVEASEQNLRSFAWSDHDKNYTRDQALHDAEMFYSGVMSGLNAFRLNIED